MGVLKKADGDASGEVQRQQQLLIVWWALLLAVLGLSVLLGRHLAGDSEVSNPGFADAAAVIVFVTAIATGVERILEVLWGIVDRSPKTGGWWPLSTVVGTLRTVEKDTNDAFKKDLDAVKAFLDDAIDLGDDAATLNARVSTTATAIHKQLETAQAAIDNAKLLAPGSARFDAISRATNDFGRDAQLILKRAQIQSDKIDGYLAAFGDGLTKAADIVGAFSDNPARRSMSLAAGVSLAVIAAGYLQLNIFAAILEPPKGDPLLGWQGILATGVVMGLGANPTHEVIKALQKRKTDTSPIEVPVSTIVVGGRSDATGKRAVIADTLDLSDNRALILRRSVADVVASDGSGDVQSVALATVVQTTRTIRRTS